MLLYVKAVNTKFLIKVLWQRRFVVSKSNSSNTSLPDVG